MSRDVASVTIVGRAGTHPQLSVGLTGDRVSFRVVATERRFDRAADDWVDGDEFGVTVVCWRTMATAVLNTVRKGDPVVILGRISTRRFERDGVTQYFTEVKADFIGLDVAKAGTRFCTAHEVCHILLTSGFAPVHIDVATNLMHSVDLQRANTPTLTQAQIDQVKRSPLCRRL